MRGERFKGFDPIKIDGYETVYDIWDISRRANIQNSGRAKEDIFIDFTEFVKDGIRFRLHLKILLDVIHIYWFFQVN